MPLCPMCGALQLSDAKFCEECGSFLPQPPAGAGSSLSAAATHPPTVPASHQGPEGGKPLYCTHCGTQLEADSVFCHNCGGAVEGGAIAAGAPAGGAAVPTKWGQPPVLRVVVGRHQMMLRFPEGKTEFLFR